MYVSYLYYTIEKLGVFSYHGFQGVFKVFYYDLIISLLKWQILINEFN